MATRRTTFDKLQRERAKRAKAAAKRERRLDKDAADQSEGEEQTPVHDDPQPVAELLELLEELHRKFDAKELGYEEFEKKKAHLLERLPID